MDGQRFVEDTTIIDNSIYESQEVELFPNVKPVPPRIESLEIIFKADNGVIIDKVYLLNEFTLVFHYNEMPIDKTKARKAALLWIAHNNLPQVKYIRFDTNKTKNAF